MKFSGTITVVAPRAQVFKALRDARLFASCIDGVSDLAETGPDAYGAMFETKVAYMKFAFKVAVQVGRGAQPRRSEAKNEGRPPGPVGGAPPAPLPAPTPTSGGAPLRSRG